MEFSSMMTLEKFFSEEAARCEKLRVAVQFCHLCRSREIVTLSKEDFVVGIEGGSQNRQHVDLSELHIVEQILMIFSKSPEIGKRLELLDTHIEISRKSVSQSTKALCDVLSSLNGSTSRLFQPAHIIIDFVLNDGSGKATSQEASDVLVLNLETAEKSQHDCIETVPEVPFCYTSILHVSQDVSYTKLGDENTETKGFPYINEVVQNITENIVSDQGMFFTIRIVFLLPSKDSRKLHSEEFYSFVQEIRKREMEETIISTRVTAIKIKNEIKEEKRRLSKPVKDSDVPTFLPTAYTGSDPVPKPSPNGILASSPLPILSTHSQVVHESNPIVHTSAGSHTVIENSSYNKAMTITQSALGDGDGNGDTHTHINTHPHTHRDKDEDKGTYTACGNGNNDGNGMNQGISATVSSSLSTVIASHSRTLSRTVSPIQFSSLLFQPIPEALPFIADDSRPLTSNENEPLAARSTYVTPSKQNLSTEHPVIGSSDVTPYLERNQSANVSFGAIYPEDNLPVVFNPLLFLPYSLSDPSMTAKSSHKANTHDVLVHTDTTNSVKSLTSETANLSLDRYQQKEHAPRNIIIKEGSLHNNSGKIEEKNLSNTTKNDPKSLSGSFVSDAGKEVTKATKMVVTDTAPKLDSLPASQINSARQKIEKNERPMSRSSVGSIPGSAVASVQESIPVSAVASVQESIPGSAVASVQESIPGSAVASVQESIPVPAVASVQETIPVPAAASVTEFMQGSLTGWDSREIDDPVLTFKPFKVSTPSLSPPPSYSSQKPLRALDPPLLSASAPNHLFSSTAALSPPPTYSSHEIHAPATAPASFPPLELMRHTPRSSPPAPTLEAYTPPRGNQLIFQPTPGTPPQRSITPRLHSVQNSSESIGNGIQNIRDALQCGNSVSTSIMKKDLMKNFDMSESFNPVAVLPRAQDLNKEGIEGAGTRPDDGFVALRASLVAELLGSSQNLDPESSNGCPIGESEESAAAYGLKAYTTMRDHLFSKRDWATNSTDDFFKSSGEMDRDVGDGVDLNSDTGRVESVLTESDYDENNEILKEMNVNVNVSIKEKEKRKRKDGEEEEMKILVQALLSDPISRDSRDRALQPSPPPRALPLHIPPLQIPSFTSSLSSHSSITEPLYGTGQTRTQYTDVDQALILSALHPRDEHYTKSGDDCNSDYVTDICSADTDDNMDVRVEGEGEGELDLRASLTSVTDQKVRTALGIISDAVEADRNRNILSSVPDILKDDENVLCQESRKTIPGLTHEEKVLTSKKMSKKTDFCNENKIKNQELIDEKKDKKKEYVNDEAVQYEMEERERSTRRTFTDEETSILSAAMLSLSREQERREERNTVNFQFLVTTDEAVEKIYEEEEEDEIIEEEQEDKEEEEEVEEEVEEEEVVEEEVQRMIDALNLTEFKKKQSDARTIKSDVRQVIYNGNIDIYNEKEIQFQSSSSCDSEYEVCSENGTRSVVPLKARRGVEKRVLDLDFTCQDEGNSVKDKEEAIQDGNPPSNREPLSSSVSHSYSSDSKGRYEDNDDRGRASRPGTGQVQGQGSRPGTGTGRVQGQGKGQGHGSRPGTGQEQVQEQGSRPRTGQEQGQVQGPGSRPGTGRVQGQGQGQEQVQGQGSRPGTGQGQGQGSRLGTEMSVNLDPYERKLSSRSSSSAGLGNINAHDNKLEKFGHTEHLQSADSVTRSTDSENMSGNVRGSISDFDGSYVKAQQLLAMLESSNKDTGRTSTSTRSNTTTPQILTPGCTRVVDVGGRDSEGVSGQITRGTVKGDKPRNSHQILDNSNSQPAPARDGLSNSQYGSEGHHGNGDAARRNHNENEIPSSSRSTKAEEKERSIEEERVKIGVKDMLKNKERERNNLKMDLAECRVLIEDKRNSAMEELFRRRKVQGLEILSRLVLDPRPRPQFSLSSTQSHRPGNSSDHSVPDHADHRTLNRPESGSRHRLRSPSLTASDQGPGSGTERETGSGRESGTGSEREAGSGRETASDTGRGSGTGRETGSGRESGTGAGRGSGTGTGREAGSGSGRDTGRASKAGLNIDTDSRMRGESSLTPRGHLESKSSDGSKSDLMQWKGTVDPIKIGVWDGVNKVPSQGQGEAPSWARNREGDRNRAEDDDEEDRTCLSGRMADQPKAVTAVAGKKAIPQRSHLSDAQKDSIIRQIRAASAGRVRRPVLIDPLNTEDEYAHDDEGGEGDTDRVTEHTAENRSVVRSQVQQGVLNKGQEQQQKLDSGMHSISLICHDPRDVDKNMISSVQQLQRKSDVDISHKPSSLSSYSHTSSDGTYPRERAPMDGGVVALQNYSSNVKPDTIPESGSRVHRNNEVLKNRITEGIQEEKEQDRGSSRESKKKGSFIECGGLIEEDEVKRLAKFEKMKEKKIAEAQARLLEKEREKDRVRSSRTGMGVGLGSKVPVQTPIFVPPLPSDSLSNRRSQLNSGNDDIGSSRQAQLTDRDRDSKWRHSDDCDAINKTQGEDVYGNQFEVEVEVDDQGVDSRGMDKGGDNGYLKQHMQHRKDIDSSSSTLLRRHSTNSRENENQDLDYEQDQTTVRSRASSLSVRSTGSKGRSSSAGKGGSSLVPFGGRSKALSNIQQVKNAINLVCLAGGHFDVQRAEAVRAIELCSTSDEDTCVTQVLVLVNNSKSLSFKALYAVHPIDGSINRIYGRGPRSLPVSQIDEFYKYESSSRTFRVLTSRALTGTTDAISIDPNKLKKLLLSSNS